MGSRIPPRETRYPSLEGGIPAGEGIRGAEFPLERGFEGQNSLGRAGTEGFMQTEFSQNQVWGLGGWKCLRRGILRGRIPLGEQAPGV